MRVLDAAAMREVDRRAIEELGIPALVLMENAALGVVEALAERFPAAERVAIYCGPGNNGGDGLAVARQLATRGYEVEAVVVAGGRELAGDAAVQLDICRNLGLSLREAVPDEGLAALLAIGEQADLVVDALFGTGLARALDGQYAALVEGLSALPVPKLAVDLPSGLDASRAERIGPSFVADLTVVFAAPKIAHVLPPAADACGEVVIADLGVPREWVEDAPGQLHLLVGEELAGALGPRPAAGHKGTFGHALLVCGSPGKSGAAILAARAAVVSGAGLVTVAVPAPLVAGVDLGSVESLTLGLAAGADGGITEAAVEEILAAARDKSLVAVGPGLGQGAATAAAIRRLVRACSRPMLIDADGLNAFAGRLGEIAVRSAPTILTPHPGELARLLGRDASEIQADRLAAARAAARASGAIVVLKGHLTIVATSEGEAWINPTGNPAMASGGSGDVLTGLLAALLAQGFEPVAAAQLATYLHGLAGDLAHAALGGPALPAARLVDYLPAAFDRLAAA